MVDDQKHSKMDNLSAGMPAQGQPASSAGVQFYEIHIQGHLSRDWSDWLEGLQITLLEDGGTILSGPLDQSALMGLLNKLSRLNLALNSINQVNPKKDTK